MKIMHNKSKICLAETVTLTIFNRLILNNSGLSQMFDDQF
jgi:hypothetical protein